LRFNQGEIAMKGFTLLFLFCLSAWAEPFTPDPRALPGETLPLPTEDLNVPGETPRPSESEFREVVEGAGEMPEAQKKKSPRWRPDLGRTSAENRSQTRHTVLGGYQLLTIWLPSKFALGYAYNVSEKWAAEFEYSWAGLSTRYIGVDLGSITERRYTLHGRRFLGNSFNFTLGAFYQDFTARASARILGQGTDIANFGAEGLGVTSGIGNRWQFGNGFTVGIDWIRLNIPLVTTRVDNEILKDINDQSDRSDVRKVIRTFNRVPTVVVLGLNLGYSF
jgi:hypothetical protein